jgi:hypothetical protein
MYRITDYTRQKAKELNVTIKPSKNKNKKIDVYKNGVKVASIGSIKNLDYPSHILKNGLEYAHERRRLYRIRHSKDLKIKDSPGFYANKLLW